MEKKKEEKKSDEKDFIRIESEDLNIRIRRNQVRIQEAINLLKTFQEKYEGNLDETTKIEEPDEDEGSIIEIDSGYSEEETPQLPKLPKLPRIKEEIKQPIQQPQQRPQQEGDEEIVSLNEGKSYKKCPVCSSKIKRKKVQQFDDGLRQEIFCKNKRCGWKKIYKIAI